MGRVFVQEFDDALWQYSGSPYPPMARLAVGGPPTVLGFGPDRRARTVAFHPPQSAPYLVRSRMEETAELINALDSPCVARHFEIGEGTGGRLWVAAEYVPGPSLPEAVERFGPLSREGVRHLARGLIELTGRLHDAGLAGRGLEPADLVLGRTGPVLVDPGFARVEGTGGRIETGGEFESWDWCLADDVRALGAVLYIAVTGRPAFHGCGDILSPAVGACPSALREPIEASQRARPESRPSLAELARAADEGWAGASLSAHWLEEPWQSPEVLRDVNARAQEVDELRRRFLDREIIAATAPPSLHGGRRGEVRWTGPGTAADPEGPAALARRGLRGAWRALATRRRQ